ncbi:STM3941 family protein [Bradyrhizobium viridifuturi]|uniref:STM3941 family protein n=1 Tax=Bradyrhizobium viridifuturi TaxID=1654716 RepID=UPI00067EFB95|nr:STM3941 family protein [Bradyrhizobium viridifuturi]
MRPGQDLPDVEIGISFWKALGLLVVCAVFWLGSAAILFGWIPGKAPNTSFIGYVLFMITGVGACLCTSQLLSPNRTVIVINRYGVRDLRTSLNLIPWQSVESIDICRSTHETCVVLKLTPAASERFATMAAARGLLAISKVCGLDGIPISATTLTVSPGALLKICNTYLAAARGSEPGQVVPSA